MSDKRKTFERLMSLNREEVNRLFDLADTEKIISNSFSTMDYILYLEDVDKTIKRIEKASNARLIVLETWLFLDYSIREILRRGLDLKKFCDESFDPLPNGFRDCLNMLNKFIEQQKNKPRNPYFAFSEVKIPKGLWDLLYKYEKIFNEILKVEEEYFKLHNINMATIIDPNDASYQNVDLIWLKSVENLGEVWFKNAEKINQIRNKAAHVLDEEEIFKILGIKGKNKNENLRKFCLKLLSSLIGLK